MGAPADRCSDGRHDDHPSAELFGDSDFERVRDMLYRGSAPCQVFSRKTSQGVVFDYEIETTVGKDFQDHVIRFVFANDGRFVRVRLS